MIQLTLARRNKIIDEVKVFLQYDTIYTQREWAQYLEFCKEDGQLEKIIDAFESFDVIKLVIQYMYSHVNSKGELARLYDVMNEDDYVKEHHYFFTTVRRNFIHLLMHHHQPLFFFDVDNTLTFNGAVSQEKIDYIRNYKYRDDIVLCSGRMKKGIDPIIHQCNIENNYCACMNGSVIYHGDTIVKEYKLGIKAKEIIQGLEENKLDYVCYYHDGIAKVGEIKPNVQKALAKYDEDIYVDVSAIDYDKIIKINVLINKDEKENKEKVDQVNKIISKVENVCAHFTAPDFYEIFEKGINKGSAVLDVCNLTKTYYRNSIGIGDSFNDYSMLTLTGYSFVVSTACEEMKNMSFSVLEDDRNVDIVSVLKQYENRDVE